MSTTAVETVPVIPSVTDFFSPANRRRFAVWWWTPPGDGPFPLLLLLHGVNDSGGHGWWMNGHAPRAVATMELTTPPVVVMPTDTGAELGSGYADWADGTTQAETFLIDELLPWATDQLPVSDTRWVTGLSMGGYGSLLLALRHPGTFASATAMSAFFRPQPLLRYTGCDPRRVWGDDPDAHDVTRLVHDPQRTVDLRLAFDCGTADLHAEENRAFHRLLRSLGVAHGYAEHPGGHEWAYWRAHLADHVRFHAGLPGPLDAGASS